MSGTTPTVISAGGATVTSSGIYTAQVIQQVQQLLNNFLPDPGTTTEVIYGQNGVPPIPTVPAGSTGTYALIVPNSVSAGSLAVPDGYGTVFMGVGSSGTVSGGNSYTTVISSGTLAYTGTAGTVADSNGNADINDSAVGAFIVIGGGSSSVTASGAQQVVRVDNGTNAITASGAGDTFQLGDPTVAAGGATAAQANAGSAATVTANVLTLAQGATGALVNINSGSNTINSQAGSATINGNGGSSTIFAATNDVYYGNGGSTLFVGSGSAQTVFGGSGNSTVFGNAAGSQIVDHFGTGQNIFVAEAAAATVFGAGTGAIFGGTGSTDAILGTSNNVFVGSGGTDSVFGGASNPTVFAVSNELLSIVGSHTAIEVATGSQDVLNATNTNGGNNFFALSTTGNTTLIGATGGVMGDTFDFNFTGGGTAHTVTIQNWHTGDGVFLNNYSAADIQTFDNAINSGGSSITLSDGTTITFQGAHPQHAIGTGGF